MLTMCWYCKRPIVAGGFIAFGDKPMHSECAMKLDQNLKALDILPPLPAIEDLA